ncbi:MAG TPA: sterol desaturase family protein [Albidovulum sp.]|uniref:sterol desaturase family protein n=1 Tax=Albidovulum sp. TaxID=1872424 RepID=UPI001DF04746|nr:sterol desaturase family protein [Paracoccaceae bacterium]HPE25749.1 sterol desaturase family protein [Albidovulum sp.]HRV62676.1 sterol desaturase family protein [Albidovulum sp.]
MDDLKYGIRDKRGNWAPNEPLEIAPFWTGNFGKMGRWLIDYLWPHNTIFMAVTLAYWYLILPDWEEMKSFSWGWILWLHLVNSGGIFLLFGSIEFFYYVKRKQENRFKYNHKFPSEQPSDVFWFKSQNLDNFLRTFLISIPLWTLIEAFTLWCFANGYALWLGPDTHWLWLAVLILLVPAIHEVHFFCGHWLIHQGVLYKWIHSIHHNSINPSPWSSMSMHPVEAAFFFSEMMWHLLIPSNPFVALFQVTSTAYGAVVGHIGFDRLEMTDKNGVVTHAYTHYLHHKYFEVNYGGDGLVPLDKWFGTWHDGTKAADEQMKERFRKKKERVKAKQAPTTPAE